MKERAVPREEYHLRVSFRRLLSAVPVLALVVSSPVARLPPPVHAAASVPLQPAGGQMLVIENAGQFDPAVRFQVQARGMILWVAEDSLWITKLMEEPRSGPADGPDPTDPLESLPRLGARRGV